MGIYLKNANDKFIDHRLKHSTNQLELIKLLEKIWNNQDFLNSEDLKTLKFLGEKGL